MSVVKVEELENCVQTDSFYFNPQPRGTIVREGQRVYLDCGVSNRCNIKFHWELKGERVKKLFI